MDKLLKGIGYAIIVCGIILAVAGCVLTKRFSIEISAYFIVGSIIAASIFLGIGEIISLQKIQISLLSVIAREKKDSYDDSSSAVEDKTKYETTDSIANESKDYEHKLLSRNVLEKIYICVIVIIFIIIVISQSIS